MRERALLIVLTLLCVGCSGGSLKVSPTTWLEVQLGEFDGLRYERVSDREKEKKRSETTLDTRRLPRE